MTTESETQSLAQRVATAFYNHFHYKKTFWRSLAFFGGNPELSKKLSNIAEQFRFELLNLINVPTLPTIGNQNEKAEEDGIKQFINLINITIDKIFECREQYASYKKTEGINKYLKSEAGADCVYSTYVNCCVAYQYSYTTSTFEKSICEGVYHLLLLKEVAMDEKIKNPLLSILSRIKTYQPKCKIEISNHLSYDGAICQYGG